MFWAFPYFCSICCLLSTIVLYILVLVSDLICVLHNIQFCCFVTYFSLFILSSIFFVCALFCNGNIKIFVWLSLWSNKKSLLEFPVLSMFIVKPHFWYSLLNFWSIYVIFIFSNNHLIIRKIKLMFFNIPNLSKILFFLKGINLKEKIKGKRNFGVG